MADPIRLYAEFRDDLGDDWRLNIHDANYSSSAIEFKLGADGLYFAIQAITKTGISQLLGARLLLL